MALPSLMNTFHHRNHPHSDQAHVETHKYTTEKREERRERGDRTQAKKEGETNAERREEKGGWTQISKRSGWMKTKTDRGVGG
jgi:hypothetical protein